MADDDIVPDDIVPDEKRSLWQKAIEPITSYPETYSQMNREAREQVGHGIGQLSHPEGALDVAKGAGNVALGTMGYVASPIAAGLRTVVGKPFEDVTRVPKEYSEFAAGLAIPGYGLRGVSAPKPVPKPPQIGHVTLSEGQATGDLPAIQREQAALRGQSGKPAYDRATAFAEQQAAELGREREGIHRGLDPFGGSVAETPQKAGEIASQGFRSAADVSKAAARQAYEHAGDMGGAIHSGVFEGIGNKVKADLFTAKEPVIVDALTPNAEKAIKYLDDIGESLRVENKANPYFPKGSVPLGEGVSLEGVNHIRKNLVQMRRDAYKGSDSDQRAMRNIIDSFDNRIDDAVNGNMFSGDKRAIDAWNTAREAHADYKKTFGKQTGDPVGRVVQKVLGDRANDPASGNAVADFLFGSTGVNPTDVNRATATRFKNVLGENSTEWSAVKQGLWSRIIERGGDIADWTPKKQADRINQFLNIDGKEMAGVVFSPAEREMMQGYANLMRKLEVPQAGPNWSNNTFKVQRAIERVGTGVGSMIGMAIGAIAGHKTGIPLGGEGGAGVGAVIGAQASKAGQFVGERVEARQISKQMPILANQMQNWATAYVKATTNPTPASQRMLMGATIPLDSTLRKLGTSMDEIYHGAVPAAAEPEQNKRYGGRANKPNHGAKSDPPIHGARRASDGKWYVSDPKRHGRFLRVDL